MNTDMSSVVEEDTKGKRVAYKDMHTVYEAEQKRADQLSRGEAAAVTEVAIMNRYEGLKMVSRAVEGVGVNQIAPQLPE